MGSWCLQGRTETHQINASYMGKIMTLIELQRRASPGGINVISIQAPLM